MYTDISFWITQKELLPLSLVISILSIFSLFILFCIHINSENNFRSKGIVRKVVNSKILKYSCYFCILLFLVYIVGYPEVHKRRNKIVTYESCYICSDKYFADLWEENNLALFNTNTHAYKVLEFNKYDEDKNLLPKQGGYIHIQRFVSEDGKDGSIVKILTSPDDKKSWLSILVNDKTCIIPNKVEQILCDDCYNSFFDADNHNNFLDIALINFSERTIMPLERTFKNFQSGDYLIEYGKTVSLDGEETGYQEEISVIISYLYYN